jgi:hypothetical protein
MEPASERRFAFYKTVQLGRGDNQLCLSEFKLGLDLTALRTVFSVTQLSPQFFDVVCDFVDHLRLLTLVKDDRRGREAMVGSRIANATGEGGEWGSRFAEAAHQGGWSKLGEPLIL